MDIGKYYVRKGRLEECQQITVNMLKEKADIAFIAKVTGLSKHKVQQIKRRTGTNNSH